MVAVVLTVQEIETEIQEALAEVPEAAVAVVVLAEVQLNQAQIQAYQTLVNMEMPAEIIVILLLIQVAEAVVQDPPVQVEAVELQVQAEAAEIRQ